MINCPHCSKEITVTWSDLGDYTCSCGCQFYLAHDANYDGYWFFIDEDEPINYPTGQNQQLTQHPSVRTEK